MKEPMREPHDDIDELFASMSDVDPPANFIDHVLARSAVDVRPEPVSPGVLGWLLTMLYVSALAGLAYLAYAIGVTVARSGAVTLVATLQSDVQIWADSPDVVVGAIVASFPWWQVAAVALDLAVLTIVTREALHAAARRRLAL